MPPVEPVVAKAAATYVSGLDITITVAYLLGVVLWASSPGGA